MIEPLGEGLWESRFDFTNGGVHFPGRMVVATLDDGRLWLWSPVPIDDALAAELAALGPVGHIVAPNSFHHVHFAAATERFPDARRYLPKALATKKPKLAHDELLTDDAPDAWSSVLEQRLIKGMPKLDEVVFFHRPSKSLVVTDLIFNMTEHRGWLSALVFRVAGTYKRCGQSRLLRSFVKDRKAAAVSARKVLEWDFEQVVMAHGEVLRDDAPQRLRDALSVMLAA